VTAKGRDYPGLVRGIRRQLGLSQERLAEALGVSFATVNRWENGHVKPSRLALRQLNAFCTRMVRAGKLRLSRTRI